MVLAASTGKEDATVNTETPIPVTSREFILLSSAKLTFGMTSWVSKGLVCKQSQQKQADSYVYPSEWTVRRTELFHDSASALLSTNLRLVFSPG